MAGIGFELKKIFKENRLFSLFHVYGYSALLSSGTWFISILSILFIGILRTYQNKNTTETLQFQVTVTYLLALSLIFSGLFQLSFSRYIADRIFEERQDRILPSFIGILSITILAGMLFIFPFCYFFTRGTSVIYMILFVGSFISLSGMWIANTLLLGIKKYKLIFWAYFFSYLLIVILAFTIGNFNLEGLMVSFFVGNTLLFFFLSSIIVYNYHSGDFISFDFILNKNERLFPCLIFGGLFYNLGIWIDKFIFWFSSSTGYYVIGKLSASVIYDLPLFLAYMSIIPGMAIFFYRLEADFAEKYEYFYDAVREGGTLEEIKQYKEDMTDTIRIMIREAVVVQGIFDLLLYFYSPSLFEMLNIPKLYLPIFNIDLLAVQLQLGFMSMLSVLYYMDKRIYAMWLAIAFFVLNFIFSLITVNILGPLYFGYGFALSVFICFVISMILVRDTMRDLEYETFMLQ